MPGGPAGPRRRPQRNRLPRAAVQDAAVGRPPDADAHEAAGQGREQVPLHVCDEMQRHHLIVLVEGAAVGGAAVSSASAAGRAVGGGAAARPGGGPPPGRRRPPPPLRRRLDGHRKGGVDKEGRPEAAVVGLVGGLKGAAALPMGPPPPPTGSGGRAPSQWRREKGGLSRSKYRPPVLDRVAAAVHFGTWWKEVGNAARGGAGPMPLPPCAGRQSAPPAELSRGGGPARGETCG